MTRIAQKLGETIAAGRKGLIVYVTAGYPDLETTKAAVVAVAAAGADIVELGIPFSDPIADGPVIQKAATAALATGIRTADIFALVSDVRRSVDIPLALMTYVNTIIQYGPARFVDACRVAGVDGIIVPDLPLEESASLQQLCCQAGVDLIRFIAPTTPAERVEAICAHAEGFLYCVSTTGVTGVQSVDYNHIATVIAAARTFTTIPAAIGFGIGSPAAARAAARHADAVIVGSAVVERLASEGPAGVGELVASLRQALDQEVDQ